MGKISSLLLGAVSGAAAAYFLTSKKGKEITEKVQDFVVDYREDPDKTHEAVVQSVKDFSDQAVKAINQTKEKVENGEITAETVLESVKDTTKSVVDYSQDKFQEIKEKFEKEEQIFEEEVFEMPTEEEEITPSEDIIIDLETEAKENEK
ncbi:YtxH domain-containing protein [Streptococcus cristatus]|uniref:YtxH domain-containing protein n=1 Tax=Streptococcus cristatus TaxID=45634 RepID=UPI0022847218|nr:YtxH domain-containing protein [Streptococcus cristatus]MCY7218116.1 YtxH domain-containing protein [Streptococcus cristatus]